MVDSVVKRIKATVLPAERVWRSQTDTQPHKCTHAQIILRKHQITLRENQFYIPVWINISHRIYSLVKYFINYVI